MTCHKEGQEEYGGEAPTTNTQPSFIEESAVSSFLTTLQQATGQSMKDPSPAAQEDQSLIQVSAQILRHALIGQAQKIVNGQQEDQERPLLPLADRMLKLDRALTELAKHDPAKAQMVELCYFAGMKKHDAAEVLGWSEARFHKEWLFTKAWIRRHIEK